MINSEYLPLWALAAVLFPYAVHRLAMWWSDRRADRAIAASEALLAELDAIPDEN